MVDYVLFEPRVWRQVCVDGTLAEFLSSALFQVVRRVHCDRQVGEHDYPSFELDWRRSLASRLSAQLPITPEVVCPTIHTIIPVGVSSADALHAITVAMPKNLQNPYVVTVQSSAVDDRCGSLAITQPMHYTVVNINCVISPRLLGDVCRELRVGHKAVVHELSNMRADTNRQLSIIQTENVGMKDQLSIIRTEMATLVTRLTTADQNSSVEADVVSIECTRSGCTLMATQLFRSGKRQKQCNHCLAQVTKSKAKRRRTTINGSQ
jgi:hypothetical protein